jgi:hypothetical protein
VTGTHKHGTTRISFYNVGKLCGLCFVLLLEIIFILFRILDFFLFEAAYR